jgi:hypothetical protein
MAMQLHHKPTKILLVGMSGSGKSVYQSRFVAASTDNYDRIFIFDHKLEFLERMKIIPCYNEQALIHCLERGDKFISYNHTSDFPGDSETAFQFFSEWVFEMSKALQGRNLFVTDEINRFTTSSEMGWEFRQLIEDGRLQGLDFIGTAHSANSISNKLRLQLSEIVALRTKDKRALEFLDDCGFDTDEITRLETGQFICYTEVTGEFTRGRLFFPQNKPLQDDDNGVPVTHSPDIPPDSSASEPNNPTP